MTMRPWIELAFMAAALTAGLVLIFFSANLYDENNMRLIARGQLAGKRYDAIEPERENIREYVRLMDRKEIVVLGSSRMLPISSASFPGHDFVNLALSHASIEDSIATYHLLYKNQKLPRIIIITFEDWVFNANSRLNRYVDWADVLERARQRIDYYRRPIPCRNSSVLGCLDWFYSLSYSLSPLPFQWFARLSAEQRRWVGRQEIVALHEIPNTNDVGWQPDRSYQYGYRGADYVEDNIRKWKRPGAEMESYNQLYYHDFTQLDPRAAENIEKFLRLMQQDNVAVIIFFPPMHPKAFEALPTYQMGRLSLESEKLLRELAAKLNIEVWGSNDPTACGAGSDGFVDAIHLRLAPMVTCIGPYTKSLEGYFERTPEERR